MSYIKALKVGRVIENRTVTYKAPGGGGVLALLGYPEMCHFPGYTFSPKILKQDILFAQEF